MHIAALALLVFLTSIPTSTAFLKRGLVVQKLKTRSLECETRPVPPSAKLPAANPFTYQNTSIQPKWEYLNGIPWYNNDAYQQHNSRLHSYLSMSAYGNYKHDCPKTFTTGFEILQEFNTSIGQSGYAALIPQMKNIVLVFKGYGEYQLLDWDTASIEDIVDNCKGCEAAQGIKSLYISAKEATKDWDVVRKEVAKSKLRVSVTGHGIGGAVSALAALDLGSKKLVTHSYNQGMPRALNLASVSRYDSLFQGLASQSLSTENDFMVKSIPKGTFFHVGTKVKIFGENQKELINCFGNNENKTCIGNGKNITNHKTYFTEIATCGDAMDTN
ncbi:hypothetical protein O181_060983 [Austropuccinia psidii MF-1]|uniref:Fungal lipase-type domain-containing protein n=1 Tax=Austropuccinia psidii MF-1 TaxID=1389203 RepID=A0A9Q3EHB9_9BASI|nr:hypothetical protein [Austropuccinia psidii MF-1]